MLILVGPSASGKTELLKILMKKYGMKKLVTYTTRQMRINETNGIDYHFISKEDFLSKAEEGFFFETVEYNNNYYGTSKNDFSINKAVILEPNGLEKYINEASDKIVIVVLTCDSVILKQRMVMRGDSEESINKRINGDSSWFTEELTNKADLVLDTSYSDLYEDALKVYSFYQEAIKKMVNYEDIR